MPEKWATAAWQGISLKVPEDWSLVGVSGDDKNGYMRVDSPVASTLEVRWSAAAGKPPDLMAKGREFLSTLEKNSKKKKIRFESKIKPEKDAGGSVGFQWKGDRLGQGRLTYCPECDRVMIAQVVSPRDENVSQVAPVILGSMRDHRSDGWVNWGLYGLEFAVPNGYRIEKHSLMSGYLSLAFKSRAKTLVVERWGLAGTLIGDGSLADWYKKDVKPDIKGFRVEVTEEEIRGHQGLKVTGRAAGIKQALRAAAYALTLYSNPRRLTGYAWKCDESNRLFSVRATHVEGEDTAEKVRDFIKCHA